MNFSESEVRQYFAVVMPSTTFNGTAEVRCPCPIHHGDRESFAIQTQTGQCYCHSECAAGGDLIWLQQQLSQCDFPTAKRAVYSLVGRNEDEPPKPKQQAKLIATYDYSDANGVVQYQVLRYSPKGFKQRRSAADWSVKGIAPLPFGLPFKTHDVFIVEGEKCALALRTAGFEATCNSGGAGKFRASLVPYFAGKRIVILPDNDKPGRDHAAQVAALTGGRIVAVPGPEHSGPDDYIAEHGAKALWALIDAPETKSQGATNWQSELKKDLKGSVRQVLCNSIIPLTLAPEYAGAFRFNRFSLNVEATRDLCGGRIKAGEPITDFTASQLTDEIQRNHDIFSPTRLTKEALHTVAQDRSYHPVLDYLLPLKHDGVKRLDTWLVKYAGVAASNYAYIVGRNWMISCVARVMKPGCKADHCIILEGPTGIGKSTSLEILGGEWYTDDLPDVSNAKEAAIAIAGKWIVEVSEMHSFTRPEAKAVKQFLSRKTDHYRPVFGQLAVDVPRQTIFGGTTEQNVYFTESTNRRFWPVACTKFDLLGLAKVRDQLWAEALAMYNAGVVWHLTDADAILEATAQQQDRRAEDPWFSAISSWISGHEVVTTAEVLQYAVQLEVGKRTTREDMKVSHILKSLGWTGERVYKNGVQVRAWRKTTTDD